MTFTPKFTVHSVKVDGNKTKGGCLIKIIRQIYATSIVSNQEETFSIFYKLGFSEEHPEVPLLVISNEQL